MISVQKMRDFKDARSQTDLHTRKRRRNQTGFTTRARAYVFVLQKKSATLKLVKHKYHEQILRSTYLTMNRTFYFLFDEKKRREETTKIKEKKKTPSKFVI